jgi:hypothetical protein
MEVKMSAPFHLSLRPALLLGCAACAFAALDSAPASAQAFQLNPTKVFGDATFDRGTPGVETITVNSPTAVIDWSPGVSNIIPNPFVFLPAGNVATFQNGASVSDFVALNRILVTVPVRFDGHVVSQLVTASGTTRGGTLLFSTPGGIIIGASAVFDVGSLVLTTLGVNVDAAGNFYDPATRGFSFAVGPQPAGSVVTEAAARINAPSPHSYVAFVAPTIDHEGNVQVNGAAAYIAGNQVEMRANDGLFDIVVPVGTDSATPITHGGTTGGPASTGAADIHRIYMVAVPRSRAITAVLTGNIGFDAPLAASVENGEIVLSAGYNVAAGAVDASAPVVPDQAANLAIQGGTISSSLTGYAVTDASASGVSGGQLHAVRDLTLVGGHSAMLSAGPGQLLTMDRNVSLVSPGGTAAIDASGGGRVSIGGNAFVDATGIGFSPPKTGDAGDGDGGRARIYADGGTIVISGDATVRALGIGGDAAAGDYIGAGGHGEGGEARVEGANGGTVAIGGNLVADASGRGGFTSGYDASQTLVPGATGAGGHVYVVGAAGGSVTVTGSSTLAANGQGGNSILTAGGAGSGDEIFIQASGGDVTLNGPVTISAVGTGGQGAGGGTGIGGDLSIVAFRGNVRIRGATSADLSGRGGVALTNAAAGNGFGGAIRIFAEADSGAIDITSFDGHADGIGGAGRNGASGGAGGGGQGGEVDIETSTDLTVVGARPGVHFGALTASADGTGGAGGSGTGGSGGAAGAGTGGEVTLAASQAPIAVDGQTRLSAAGTGGAASAGGGPGGTGTGGTILATADRTTLALGANAVIGANGRGGDGPTGGAGLGGAVGIHALGGPTASTVSGGTVSVSAAGQGGAGANAVGTAPAGRGGDGRGGSIELLADAVRGAIAFGTTSADAGGTGGNAGNAPSLALSGRGGDGTGGSVTAGTEQNADPNCTTPATCAAAASGSATFASLRLSATGTGGQGGTGGTGRGGATTLQSVGARTGVTAAATLRADATAGATSAGGVAGQALGGLVALSASPHSATGTAGQIQAGSVTGSANATGGIAGSTAGSWRISANGGSIAVVDLTLDALGGAAVPADSRIDVAAGGTVTVSGSGALSSAGAIQVNASGAGRLAGGTVRFTTGTDLSISHASAAANAITIDVTDFGAATGRNLIVNAGATIRGSTSSNVQAGNLATVAGRMLGRNIRISSADIALTGGIGDGGTQIVTLDVAGASPPSQQTVLGGSAQGPGYTLTNAEAALIRAGTLQINAPALGASSTRNPDLLVRDLSFTGGGAGTGIGTLRIVTPGIARVQGNLLLAGAGATDGVALAAAERLEVVTPGGSIRVRDGAGAPGGTLALTSNDIWAVGQTILDRLHTDPAYAGRDADLANNGGTQAPRGYLEGNSVTLNAGNSLFVQNTGENPTNAFSLTGPAFGGVTVGPGGLTIRATGATPASVTAFGRRINADGSTTIGYDFFFAVDFETGAASGGITGGANLIGPGGRAAGSRTGYAPASTFNTCIIATGQCPLRRPDDTGPGGRDPVTGPTGNIQLPPGASQDEPVDTSFSTEPLIEEPVTSGGESTLWSDPCPRRTDEPGRRCDEVHP